MKRRSFGGAVLAATGLPWAERMALAQPAAVPTAAAAPAPNAKLSAPIFVLNSQDADISVLKPGSYGLIKRLPTGKEPHHLYLSPNDRTLIVANATGNSLTFLNPATAEIQRTVTGITDPYHLRFSPDMKWFVTAANRLNHVDLYHWHGAEAQQPLTLVKRINAPKTPSHLNIDSKSTVVYASLQDSDELMAIDLQTQAPRWKIAVGKMPADLYLTADDKTLLIGLTGDSVVEVYDVGGVAPRLVKRIPTGKGAHAFRALGDARHVFVSNRAANTISLIDTQTLSVVSELPGPGGPDCMEVMSDRSTLLLSSRWSRQLTVIDIVKRQVLQQVAVGRSPHGVWTLDHAPRV